MQDGGAHVGYIVSSAGVQSGAIAAARLTNLRLLSWREFQDEFESKWLHDYLLPEVERRLRALWTYTEPINSAVFRDFEKLDASHRARFSELRRLYPPFAAVMNGFTPIGEQFGRRPLRLPVAPPPMAVAEGSFPGGFFDITAYRELLDAATQFGEGAIVELRAALQA